MQGCAALEPRPSPLRWCRAPRPLLTLDAPVLRARLEQSVSETTSVWTEGLDEWTTLSEVKSEIAAAAAAAQ